MEIEESFDIIFKDWNSENSVTILPLIRKCLSVSRSEREILRALEIAFSFCLKYVSVSELEEELFRIACPVAKNIVEDKLKSLEKNPNDCVDCLKVSLQIISYFQSVFELLSESNNIAIVEAKSFLIATSEVVCCCLSHCKMSEQVYGSLFGSLAEHLSNFFKRCCALLEYLLHFLNENIKCDPEDEGEVFLLDEVMTFLSKSGIVLINLEIKTMAKVWKAFVFLLEKHLCLRENFCIEETLKSLCYNVTCNMEGLLNDNQEFDKIIKLSCFLLKLVIKFCTFFTGSLSGCQNSLFKLLLMLCRWDAVIKTQPKFKTKEIQDLLNQLTTGTEPLLSQLMNDERFVRECHGSKDIRNSVEFPILCCLILKKLLSSDSASRSLWFKENDNILEWVFYSASLSNFISSTVSLPNILINGKQKKFTNLYEYVLITTSAFLMTATAEEYYVVEKILVQNVLQRNPMKALLAIDIWCLLARFAGSELCFSQILTLSKTLQEVNSGTLRVEKWYLMTLIRRLFPLLSGSHRELFLKSFQTSFYSNLWDGCNFNGLTSSESSHIQECVLSQIDHLLGGNEVECLAFELRVPKNSQNEKFESKILRLWKFNCEVLLSVSKSERFLKILCGLTASVVSDLPPEDLLLVVSQIKKLLTIQPPICVKLYFIQILKSLATVHIPSGNFQKKIIITIAEIFRVLLSSKQPIVKQKVFETFYTFSHFTSHGEVISLSVQDAFELKLEVTNYFKKKPPEQTDFSLEDYFTDLYEYKFKHICPEETSNVSFDAGVVSKKIKLSPIDWQKIVGRWKEDGKSIVECFHLLSESDKREIKNICQSILYLPDN